MNIGDKQVLICEKHNAYGLMIAHRKPVIGECDECKIERLTKQRDDLLAALEECRGMVGHPDNIAFIDAAIAAAKEKE